jgi:putative iron-dependent peroxidase
LPVVLYQRTFLTAQQAVVRSRPVAYPQTGILALGTLSHAYLEFDRRDGIGEAALVAAAAGVAAARSTVRGVNLVVGFRPQLWAAAAPSAAPDDVTGFDAPVVGPDGFTMPATQHDLVLWLGGAHDLIFDAVIEATTALADVAVVAEETIGWSYHRDRDLTGFIDGTENPTLVEAPAVVYVADGAPGAGGSVLLLQKWEHETPEWMTLDTTAQEQAIGRTKPDSVELDDKPATSHAARTDQDTYGHIFRRNTPYGTPAEHGTMFVGFCAEQRPLAAMLESMAGLDGPRDELTRYTRPLTGAYYVIPAADALSDH